MSLALNATLTDNFVMDATITVTNVMSITFQQNNLFTTGLGSNTFTKSVNIGTAASDRFVIVGIHAHGSSGSNDGATSVTIGGVAATLIRNGQGGLRNMSLWFAKVPTGTSANVTANYAAGIVLDAIDIATWIVRGSPTLTVLDTFEATGVGTSTGSKTLITQNPSVAVGIGWDDKGGNTTFSGWVEDFDQIQLASGATPEFIAGCHDLINNTSGQFARMNSSVSQGFLEGIFATLGA
jgi:hypothetical protein